MRNGGRPGGGRDLQALGALCLLSGAGVVFTEGGGVFGEILMKDAALILAIAPKLIGAVLLVAWLRLLIPKDRIAALFGQAAGLSGLIRAAAGGALAPGGPAVAYPIIAALRGLGAEAGATVAFASGWLLLGLSRVLIWELAFLDPEIVLRRLALCLPAAVALGVAARLLLKPEPGR